LVGNPGVNGAGGLGGAASHGRDGANGAPDPSSPHANASVPLTMDGTKAIVMISVNGGPMVPVTVDTGSTGLAIESNYVPHNADLVDTGYTGHAGYGSGGQVTFTYDTYDTVVKFAHGPTTESIPVDLVPKGTFAHSAGVLGIGSNVFGKVGSNVVTGLPGLLNNGVLVDEPNGQLVFGPNTGPEVHVVEGAPQADLQVSINGSAPVPVHSIIDTGGVRGAIPIDVIPSNLHVSVGDHLPAGTHVAVYNTDGKELLYQYNTGTIGPKVSAADAPWMNTGWAPFLNHPIYLDYRPANIGTTIFGPFERDD
jgi:hypothetical protein